MKITFTLNENEYARVKSALCTIMNKINGTNEMDINGSLFADGDVSVYGDFMRCEKNGDMFSIDASYEVVNKVASFIEDKIEDLVQIIKPIEEISEGYFKDFDNAPNVVFNKNDPVPYITGNLHSIESDLINAYHVYSIDEFVLDKELMRNRINALERVIFECQILCSGLEAPIDDLNHIAQTLDQLGHLVNRAGADFNNEMLSLYRICNIDENELSFVRGIMDIIATTDDEVLKNRCKLLIKLDKKNMSLYDLFIIQDEIFGGQIAIPTKTENYSEDFRLHVIFHELYLTSKFISNFIFGSYPYPKDILTSISLQINKICKAIINDIENFNIGFTSKWLRRLYDLNNYVLSYEKEYLINNDKLGELLNAACGDIVTTANIVLGDS